MQHVIGDPRRACVACLKDFGQPDAADRCLIETQSHGMRSAIDFAMRVCRCRLSTTPTGVKESPEGCTKDRPLVGFLRRRLKIFVTLRNAVPR
jgi:hypothetical protein